MISRLGVMVRVFHYVDGALAANGSVYDEKGPRVQAMYVSKDA